MDVEKIRAFLDGFSAPLEIQEYPYFCNDLGKLIAVARASLYGAFHHNCCPWLDGKKCGCAKVYVDKALTALVCPRMCPNG
jgi:hypothetical protein